MLCYAVVRLYCAHLFLGASCLDCPCRCRYGTLLDIVFTRTAQSGRWSAKQPTYASTATSWPPSATAISPVFSHWDISDDVGLCVKT